MSLARLVKITWKSVKKGWDMIVATSTVREELSELKQELSSQVRGVKSFRKNVEAIEAEQKAEIERLITLIKQREKLLEAHKDVEFIDLTELKKKLATLSKNRDSVVGEQTETQKLRVSLSDSGLFRVLTEAHIIPNSET